MKYIRNNKNRKGFTLVELIVVMSIIGILALLAAPSFIGKTEEANRTKHFANVRVLEDAAERYFIDHGKWPRGEEEPYTPEEVSAYAERIYDITGEEVVLEEGHYWNIDYEALRPYAKLPSEDDRADYVLRNPVGKIYYLDGLTEDGASRITKEVAPAEEAVPVPEPEPAIPDYYAVATDSDFTKVLSPGAPNKSYYWRYTGRDDYIILPDSIKGEAVTDYYMMFDKLSSVTVKGVASENPNVTNMSSMFFQSPSTSLDVSHLDTSNVTSIYSMFYGSQATVLDLSTFDTSKVTNMSYMFSGSKATTLDVSSFDTANVTTMYSMFNGSQATTLDVSSFDTANVTNMYSMFNGNQATTLDVSSFDTAKVTNMSFMFYESQAIVLDVSTFNTAKVTNMSYMFKSSKATVLNVRSFNTSSVTDMTGMFANSQATTLDVSAFDTSNVTSMYAMFFGSPATVLDLRSFNTVKVTDTTYMFNSAAARTGYARTTTDAAKFNASVTTRPIGLTFIVKQP